MLARTTVKCVRVRSMARPVASMAHVLLDDVLNALA